MADYPKYKYHPKYEPIVVKNLEEEEKLGDIWKDSPAEHGKITAPSQQQLQAMKYGADPLEEAAEEQAEESGEKETFTPRRRR